MSSLQQFKGHFILLAEAGFIAVTQTDEDAALKLFKAAEILDPQNLLPRVGRGYIHLCKLELKQAAKTFEEILKEDPSNEMAKTFLGLSMSLNPAEVAKGEKMLEDSANGCKDPMVKDLAASALAFVEKFVKKAPTPVQGAPEGKKK